MFVLVCKANLFDLDQWFSENTCLKHLVCNPAIISVT